MQSFFLSRAPSYHSFTFNSQLLYELKHKVYLSRTVCGIFHFRFRRILLKFIFLFNKKHGLFDFKTSKFFSKYKNNGKATHSFAPRLLSFKLQQKVWKFSDTCKNSVIHLKNWPGEEKLITSKFWVRHFFSIVTFKGAF